MKNKGREGLNTIRSNDREVGKLKTRQLLRRLREFNVFESSSAD